MKIIASTCIGSFTSPWLEYSIASYYNVVSEIVVVNGGYPLDRKDLSRDNVKLERESKVIKEIDVNGKIKEIRGDWSLAKNVNPRRDTVAARNMTIGIQFAAYRNPDVILEMKCDQVFYPTAKLLPTLDFTKHSGYQFAEMTNFVEDLYHVPTELKHRICDDGARCFKPHREDFYIGQGQPMIKAEQFCVDFIQTAHMRLVYPDKYSLEEKEQFAYERAWAHLMCQNSINEHPVNQKEGRKLTLEEIDRMARDSARGIANAKGVPLHKVRDPRSPKEPPLACLMEPKDYISKGYPNNLEI